MKSIFCFTYIFYENVAHCLFISNIFLSEMLSVFWMSIIVCLLIFQLVLWQISSIRKLVTTWSYLLHCGCSAPYEKTYSTYEKWVNILKISKKTSIRDILETKMQSNYNHKTRLIWLLEKMLLMKVTDREFLYFSALWITKNVSFFSL